MCSTTTREDQLAGVLLGTAVGDALGLPFEGMSRRRVRRYLGSDSLRHRFLFGRGMVSDDTDHACLVAQALLASRGEPNRFADELARRLRWWLLGAPAGVGWATLRSIVRLWLGYSPARSGVRSAGNGAAMRAPLLGVFAAHDHAYLRALVRASTRLTHTDQRAFDGALAVALAAALGSRRAAAPLESGRILLEIADQLDPGAIADLVRHASRRIAAPAQEFADEIGAASGVTGFVNHTVPVALLCWARHPRDAAAALSEVVALGGDTDTTAAIVGALCGAAAGVACLPSKWVAGLAEWPRSTAWMLKLAKRVARGGAPLPLAWAALPLRNAVFAVGVMATLLRRALPPY